MHDPDSLPLSVRSTPRRLRPAQPARPSLRERCRRPFFLLGTLALLVPWSAPFAGEIHRAIAAGDIDRVTELLRSDPGLIEARDENPFQDLPLHTAATAGRIEIARLLLDAGADLECEDRDGSTPLHSAAVSRQDPMVEFLLSRGADVNRRDRNGAYALSFAASSGDTLIVRRILDAGADLNFHDHEGRNTLLHYACSRGLWTLADRLLSRGADIDARNNHGQTPLHLACMGRFPERVEATLERGADPALPDSFGRSPLFTACLANQPEMVRALLARRADADGPDRGGETPIFAAAAAGCADCIRDLLRRGARCDARSASGSTPLRRAVDGGHAEVVELLLENGAPPEDVDSTFGWTPLHKAAAFGYENIARALIEKGADPTVRDDQGRIPFQLAVQYGHDEMMDLLRTADPPKGPLPGSAPRPLSSLSGMGPEEAEIWYLGHSGWAVKTAHHLLVFDYGDIGRRADRPRLNGGDIDPVDIAGESVTAFVSHAHGDHYVPAIFAWRAQAPRINYVLGFEPRNLPENPPFIFMPPHETRTIDGMTVSTLRANDGGVGFAVEVDGLTIFHPGDHTRRSLDPSDPFEAEIDGLVRNGTRPDIAFIPLSGCGMTDQTPVRVGTEYLLNAMKPRVLLPMHGGMCGTRYVEFIAAIQDKYPKTTMLGALCKGDHFHFRKGKAS